MVWGSSSQLYFSTSMIASQRKTTCILFQWYLFKTLWYSEIMNYSWKLYNIIKYYNIIKFKNLMFKTVKYYKHPISGLIESGPDLGRSRSHSLPLMLQHCPRSMDQKMFSFQCKSLKTQLARIQVSIQLRLCTSNSCYYFLCMLSASSPLDSRRNDAGLLL